MEELKARIHDDQNGLDYTLVGDYHIPDLKVSEHEETRPIGRWGHEHLRYIKEYRPLLYTDLALSGDLGHYLADIDEQARERLDRIMAQMRKTCNQGNGVIYKLLSM